MLCYLVSAPTPPPQPPKLIAVATPVPRSLLNGAVASHSSPASNISRSSAGAVPSSFLSLQAPCMWSQVRSLLGQRHLSGTREDPGWAVADLSSRLRWVDEPSRAPQYHCSGHPKLQGNTERNNISRPWKVLGLSRSQSYQLYTSLQGVQGTCSKSTCKRLKQLAERLKVPVLSPGQPTEFCKQHFI